MTEREAEAFAAKLTRIWMPSGSFGEGATWELRDGDLHFTARITDEVEMWFGPSDVCGGPGFHLRCARDGGISDFLYCSVTTSSVCRAAEPPLPEEEQWARFSEWYMLLMRSRCWLSGCPLQASDEEQERWTAWQREREEDGAGESTNTVDWEVRRVAAALDVESVTMRRTPMGVHYEGWVGDVMVTWALGDPNARVKNVCVGTRSYCGVFLHKGQWEWEAGQEGHELMARGLYRLGIEDEEVLSQLNVPLSMHEKMELRLSMPREFWPVQWS